MGVNHLLLAITVLGKLAEAAKKAFDAKVKENDEFVSKMKKEI